MRRLTFLLGIWILGAQLPLQAQQMILKDIEMTVDSTTHLQIEGGIRSSGSVLTNEGTLTLSDSFANSDGSTYVGDGGLDFSGDGSQAITGLAALQNFSVDNGAFVELTEDLTLTGTLSLNDGKLKLGSYSLILSPTATVTGYDADNYIQTDGIGTVDMELGGSAVLFPVGNDTYAPVSIQNAGTTDTFRVRVVNDLLTDGTSGTNIGADAVGKTWLISEDQAGGSDVTLSLQWMAAEELTGFDHSAARFLHHNGVVWEELSTQIVDTVSTGVYSLTQTGVDDFSPFGVNSSASSLPVEWLHFGVRREAQTAILEWEIAPAKNLAYFSIERSQDAKSFQKLGEIKPSTQTAYRFVDREPGQTLVYYRIKQTDWDGQVSYTAVRSLYFGEGVGTPQLYPNPFTEHLQIDLHAWTTEGGWLKLYDSQGRLLRREIWAAETTTLNLNDLDELASGVYHLHLQTVTGHYQLQIVKQ